MYKLTEHCKSTVIHFFKKIYIYNVISSVTKKLYEEIYFKRLYINWNEVWKNFRGRKAVNRNEKQRKKTENKQTKNETANMSPNLAIFINVNGLINYETVIGRVDDPTTSYL